MGHLAWQANLLVKSYLEVTGAGGAGVEVTDRNVEIALAELQPDVAREHLRRLEIRMGLAPGVLDTAPGAVGEYVGTVHLDGKYDLDAVIAYCRARELKCVETRETTYSGL
jgi:hypothetical protein